MVKQFFYHIESTGVKHWRHGIHQIAGCIVIDDVVKENFDFKILPHPDAIIDPDALKVGGVTWEEVQQYPPMRTVYLQLQAILQKYVDRFDPKDKFHMVGYNNMGFDNNFLRQFFIHNDDQYFGSFFWSDSIDVMALASQYLIRERPKMKDFKQSTVASYLGIKIDETRLHDAGYDMYLLRQIYNRITM